GKYYYKDEYNEGVTPYVSASDMNNGVQSFIDIEPRYKGNALTIGKVGCTTFYQPDDFCATSDVTILSPIIDFNKFIGLFMATVINQERYKWNFGRQIRLGDSMELIVKLPVDSTGKPDWTFMENYIKSLKFSDNI
ncbi:MAG: restriction endonuclease subunit S, partial [Acholeplasmataceae bacterium]|nr:restriction endonuclease subunit S [Acholeplasmataceae bacterium]